MRRRAARGHGFFMCLVLNMLFRLEWCVLALLWLMVYFLFKLPLFPMFIFLGIWILYALVVTLILSWANRSGNAPLVQNSNKNPYSKNTSDYLP